jgi:hypothetical protein
MFRYKKKELPDPEFVSRLQKSELTTSSSSSYGFHPLRQSGSVGSVRKSSRDTPQDLDVELSNYIADIDDIIRKDSNATSGGGDDIGGGGRASGRASAAKVVVWPPASESRVTTPELVTPPPTYAPLARLERHTLLGGLSDGEEEGAAAEGKGAAEIYEEAIRYNRSQSALEQGPRHRGGGSRPANQQIVQESSQSAQQVTQQISQSSQQQSSQSSQQLLQQSSQTSQQVAKKSSQSSEQLIQQQSSRTFSQTSQMVQQSSVTVQQSSSSSTSSQFSHLQHQSSKVAVNMQVSGTFKGRVSQDLLYDWSMFSSADLSLAAGKMRKN